MSENNEGQLEEGEQIRWQFEVPDSGTYFMLEVDEGEVIFYASTLTTSPNEAFYEWRVQTSSSTFVFISPRRVVKRNAEAVNETFTTVYTALFGLNVNNTFTLSSNVNPPPTEEMTTLPIPPATEDMTTTTQEGVESTTLMSPSGK